MSHTQRIVEPVIVAVVISNLIGHLRRTLLTITAIAAGLASLIFLWGFNDGLHRNMLSNFQDAIIGSIQIHRQGFFEHPRLSLYLSAPERVIEALETARLPHWSRRLETFALATSEKTTEGVMLIGMEAEREAQVTQLAQRIGNGRFLQAGDDYSLILGATTAKNLRVDLGDPIVIVGYDRFGALVAEEFTLVGIITSGEMGLDRGMALTSLRALQEMLDMSGQITGIVLRVADDRLDEIAESLSLKLAELDLEVMPWSEMFPVVQEWITLHNGFLYLFVGIVLFIVIAGELNTLWLSMLERTRDFGILMAIGTARRQIGLMLLLEAALLGVIGSLLGILLGIGVILLTNQTGIDLSVLLGSTSRFYVDPVIHPQLNLDHLGMTVISILSASLLAGIYPAWRAVKLQPVEAIRNG
ncbi:MAG: ABC transporter permease [Gammaproteobacteria bacterium]|nr:ABC transporter permease [Gammaproteobacteria bacterium]